MLKNGGLGQSEIMTEACYEIDFKGKLSPKTRGDLYIVKRAIKFDMSLGYSQLFMALDECMKHPNLKDHIIPQVKGCEVVCPGRIRCLDFAVYNAVALGEWRSPYPCLIVKFETECRSLCAAHTYCSEHFGHMPALKAVMLFKYFTMHPKTPRFAAVAVLYLRTENGSVVSDVVSFGTCSPPPSDDVPEEIARVLRLFPEPPCLCYVSESSCWISEQRPFLSLPLENFLGPSFAGNASLTDEDAASGTLTMDLWKVLKRAETAWGLET
jgi:hypothetical protein